MRVVVLYFFVMLEEIRRQHERDVGKIQDALVAHGNVLVALSQRGKRSNTVRSKPYSRERLPIDCLNRVLDVDVDARMAFVEPRVTMEELVAATLPHGLVPAVVPEFKSITVGGAINGAALESSSHRHGQFNDCCVAYHLVLGDGARLRVTPKSNSDLFYGISGSYGSLAVLVAAEVALVPALPWVAVTYSRFTSVQKAVAAMVAEHQRSGGAEFIEAIAYGPQDVVVITGEPVASAEGLPTVSFQQWWSQWFYQHVREGGHQREAIALHHYLFRADRAAFWMGGYALHTPLLLRYIMELVGWCPHWLERLLMPSNSSRYCRIKRASFLFRFLYGWIMSSERLYRCLHNDTEQWFADHFVIQDYYIPQKEVVLFCHEVFTRSGIRPLWLCPIKPTRTPQLFSPHYSDADLLVDVGVYGLPERAIPGSAVAAELDDLANTVAGKKMFYAHSYYSLEAFWSLYDRDSYQQLRQRYFAEGHFHPITDKVLGTRERV